MSKTKTGFEPYVVWSQNMVGRHAWRKTACTLKARSNKDAQARLRRRFAAYDLTNQRLVALPVGYEPEDI